MRGDTTTAAAAAAAASPIAAQTTAIGTHCREAQRSSPPPHPFRTQPLKTSTSALSSTKMASSPALCAQAGSSTMIRQQACLCAGKHMGAWGVTQAVRHGLAWLPPPGSLKYNDPSTGSPMKNTVPYSPSTNYTHGLAWSSLTAVQQAGVGPHTQLRRQTVIFPQNPIPCGRVRVLSRYLHTSHADFHTYFPPNRRALLQWDTSKPVRMLRLPPHLFHTR